MARATKRTSAVLGALALTFLCIIIILCVVSKGGPQRSHQGEGKSRPLEDVIIETETSSTSTTTTTTPATTAATTTTPATTAPTTTPATTAATTTPATTAATTTTTTIKVSTIDDTIPETTSSSTTDSSTTKPSTLSTTSRSTTVSTTLESITELSTIDSTTLESTTVSTTLESTTDLSTDESTTVSTTDLSSDESTTVSTTDLSSDESTIVSTTDLSSDESTTVSTTDLSSDESTTVSTTDLSSDESTTVSTTDLSSDESTTVSTTDLSSDESTTVSTTDLSSDESTTVSTTDLSSDESTTVSSTLETTTSSNPLPGVNGSFCETPSCKTVAANMLAMMDHSQGASPCTDFYQYACGGVMLNPFFHPRQPGIIAESMIKDQLDELDRNDIATWGMRTFYDSCLEGVDQDARQDWAQPIKELFGEHQFRQEALRKENFNFNLEETLAYMMKNDFTPFFNMEFQVATSKSNQDAFVLSLHPAVPGSRFSEDLARKVCLEDQHRKLTNLQNMTSYDVQEEYKHFMKCVRNGEGLEARLTRMEEAVRRLGLMDHLDEATSSTLLQHTINSTRTFLQSLEEDLPDIPELKRVLVNRNCIQGPFEDLPGDIDWGTLVEELLYRPDFSMLEVKVYMEDTLSQLVTKLREFYHAQPAVLNNILLMLWSERLYTDFVKPVGASVGEPQYCLRTALALMEDAASYLYLEALSQEEIDARKEQIDSVVANIKLAVERIMQRDFPGEEPTKKLQDMLEDVITASIKDAQKTADTNTHEVNFTSDFLQNSIQLLANRRNLIYGMQRKLPTEEWRVFMRPFDPFGVYNYAMNRIMIPYAAQEDSSTFKNIPDYLNYAGTGHMISNLVMHGYDTSGLQFHHDKYGEIPGYQEFLSHSQHLQQQYNAAQSYQNPNGPTANFSMGKLSLNELLADSGATRLAWEAYLVRNEPKPTDATITGTHSYTGVRRRRRSLNTAAHLPSMDSEEKPLPWLGLSPIQLYFLHWAQHQCSASSELSMLEVMESEKPPARMRVNLVLQNEPLFQTAFQCPPM